MIVFLGYSVPGFVACLLLMLMFSTDLVWKIFPLGEFRSEDWDVWWANGEYWRCIKDQIHHTAIPVIGYILAGFATMTILMKNSLLENLGADYVRTAFAKGLTERRVIFLHALRNSLLPVITLIGLQLPYLISGSVIIERIFNIPGMGMLTFNAFLGRDYPVIMAVAVLAAVITLAGLILADVAYALVDPRIRLAPEDRR